MQVTKIMTAALAHTYEEPDVDILTTKLTISLLNLGIAELTDAENHYRANDDTKELLTEPVVVEDTSDDVPYDYHITTILLPLWLAWKIFEGIDDTVRADKYYQLYLQRRTELVPIEWQQMTDRTWGCCHAT